MNIRRIAVLAMNPWSDPGRFQPFSYGAYRNATAVIADGALGDIDVRVFDTHGWPLDRWVEEVLAFDPDVVACSAYIWSTPTFYALAQALRGRAPNVRIVFGGPSARPELFALPPYPAATACIDALVIGEGEATFPDLIRAWRAGEPTASVPGLAVPSGRGFVRTAARPQIESLDDIPTPHRMGLAPRGVTAHLEAFRGCPLSCMFCQWGVQDGRRALSAESMTAELRAFKASDATGLYLVDAGLNLNAKAFKALQQAEAEVGFIQDTELACEVYPAHLNQEHLDFMASTRTYAGLGLQSLDDGLLKTLERPFSRKRFERVVRDISDVAQTHVELIVGLPGDTPEQFRRTFAQVRELPCSVRLFHCLVLPDALLTRAPAEYALDFDPITLEMRSCLGWSEEDLLRTFDFLTEEAEKHGGTWSRFFPRSVEESDLEHHIGMPLGSSMWAFPNAAHEAAHAGRGGRKRSAFVPEISHQERPSTPPVVKEPPPPAPAPAPPPPLVAKDGFTTLPPGARTARLLRGVAKRCAPGRWTQRAVALGDDALRVEYALPDGAGFVVCIARSGGPERCYAERGGLRFWYEDMPEGEARQLDLFVQLVVAAARRVALFSADAPSRPGAPA